MSEIRDAVIGRYQIVAVGRNEAVLLDTATGSSWSLARDVDTLQLGWQPLEERWPEGAFHPASDRSQMLPGQGSGGKDMGEKAAAWWRPRLKLGWARSRQSGA